jgi:membrane protease YdiL (CAAX protease family)
MKRKALGYAAAAAAIAFPFLPREAQAGLFVTMLGLTLLGLRDKEPQGAMAPLASGLLIGAWMLPIGYSQLTLPLAIAGWLLAPRFLRALPKAQPWMTAGKVSRPAQWLTAAIVISAAGALVAWLQWAKPDLASLRAEFVPKGMSLPLLLVGMAVFAAWNAMVEEICYRGILMYALDGALGAGVMSLVLQAAAFGALHIHGFPRGLSGVALAAVYGLALGILRRMTRGLVLPWLAHVTADLTIGTLLLWRVGAIS